mmetsp:Transcript_25574/g.73949  ORF Transcript_25574/g.73949 Transcript_25574/m.73949 type:complete len:102 (-) Transcript_25574:124-429(-)
MCSGASFFSSVADEAAAAAAAAAARRGAVQLGGGEGLEAAAVDIPRLIPAVAAVVAAVTMAVGGIGIRHYVFMYGVCFGFDLEAFARRQTAARDVLEMCLF